MLQRVVLCCVGPLQPLQYKWVTFKVNDAGNEVGREGQAGRLGAGVAIGMDGTAGRGGAMQGLHHKCPPHPSFERTPKSFRPHSVGHAHAHGRALLLPAVPFTRSIPTHRRPPPTRSPQVVVDQLGAADSSYEQFINILPENNCRYGGACVCMCAVCGCVHMCARVYVRHCWRREAVPYEGRQAPVSPVPRYVSHYLKCVLLCVSQCTTTPTSTPTRTRPSTSWCSCTGGWGLVMW